MCIVASAPSVSGIAHTGCTPSGTTLTGCPPGGGGTLTITGANFYGATVSVGGGCVLPEVLTVNTGYSQITCTLAAGAPGSDTGDIVVTTNGGGNSAQLGYIVYYGTSLAVCFRCLVLFAFGLVTLFTCC